MCGYCKKSYVYTSKYRHDKERHPKKNPYWIEIEDIDQKPLSEFVQPDNRRVTEQRSLRLHQSSVEDDIGQSEKPSSSHEPSSESFQLSDQPRELTQHQADSICTIDLETPHQDFPNTSSTATKQPEQRTIVTGAFSTIPVSSVIRFKLVQE